MVTRSIQSAQSQVEAPELRDPQERPQVRRRAEPPARRSSTTSAAGSSRARTCTSRSATSSTTSSTATSTPPRPNGFAEDWDLDQLWTALQTALPGLASPSRRSRTRPAAGRRITRRAAARGAARPTPTTRTTQREEALGAEVMREVERRVVLSVLDRKWREHLYEMDYLQEGIGLRAMAQRDPLVEYQREGFLLFEAMMEAIKEESVGYLFNVEVEVEAPAASAAVQDERAGRRVRGGRGRSGPRASEAPQAPARLHYSAPSDDGSVDRARRGQRPRRAWPCRQRRGARPSRRQQEEQAPPLTPRAHHAQGPTGHAPGGPCRRLAVARRRSPANGRQPTCSSVTSHRRSTPDQPQGERAHPPGVDDDGTGLDDPVGRLADPDPADDRPPAGAGTLAPLAAPPAPRRHGTAPGHGGVDLRGGPADHLRCRARARHDLDQGLGEVRHPGLRVGQVAGRGGLGPEELVLDRRRG